MRRRDLLTAVGALSIAVSGCTGLADSDDTDPGTDERTGSDDATDTDEPTDTPEESDGDHHLYLVNLDDEPHRVQLTVTHDCDDEPVIDGTYELPDERGAKFEDAAAWGETYEVTGSLETGISASFAWEIESCQGGEAPNGSRNGSLRLEPDAAEFSFRADNCDEIIAGTEVATGPAEYFAVEDGSTPTHESE